MEAINTALTIGARWLLSVVAMGVSIIYSPSVNSKVPDASDRSWCKYADDGGVSVRVLLRSTSAVNEEVLLWLAAVSAPTIVEGLEPGETPITRIRKRCGVYLNVYGSLFKKWNPEVDLSQHSTTRLVFPACPWWQIDQDISPLPTESAERLLFRANERQSSQAIAVCPPDGVGRCNKSYGEEFLEKNALGKDFDFNAPLDVTRKYKVPVLSHDVSFDLQRECYRSYGEFLAYFRQLTSWLKGQGRLLEGTDPIVRRKEDKLLVIPIISQLPQAWQQEVVACREAANGKIDRWPVDLEAVLRSMSSEFKYAQEHGLPSGERSVIGIMDTGLASNVIDSRTWVVQGPGNGNADGDGVANNPNGVGVDAQGTWDGEIGPQAKISALEYWHGSEVANLALGGGLSKAFANSRSQALGLKIYRLWYWDENSSQMQARESYIEKVISKYLVDHHVKIVNLSFEVSGADLPALGTALVHGTLQDVLFVVAAGNEHEDVVSKDVTPARFGGFKGIGSRNLISVGSVGPQAGGLLMFSNWSASNVDIAAPGCGIEMLRRAAEERGEVAPAEGVVDDAGTSFSAPLVSFSAGLLNYLGLSDPSEIKRRILITSDYRPELEGKIWSSGVLNIPVALQFHRDLLKVKDREAEPVEVDYGNSEWPVLCKQYNTGETLEAIDLNKLERFTRLPDRRVRVITRDSSGVLDFLICAGISSDANLMLQNRSLVHWDEIVDIIRRSNL